MSEETRPIYDFGPFRFLPDEKLLLRDGRPVPLPPKTIDTLAALLDRHGHVLLKDDLMRRVWPGTFVEEGNLTQQISLLRKVFADVDAGTVQIETIPRRGYRLQANVTRPAGDELIVTRERTRTQVVIEEPAIAPIAAAARRSRRWALVATLVLVGTLGLTGAGAYEWFMASRPALPFDRRDWVLILDFENASGDARFDRALASALSVGLEQSRYFNVYSRSRVADALQRMGKPAATVIGEDVATEIARRDGIRALVVGAVARVGSQFLLTARLIDPRRGIVVNAYSARAADEDALLDALDALARQVRHGLGESRASISQASLSLPKITTSSFSALQAFAEGTRAWNSGRLKDGIAAWERAVKLDPGFALAHAELGAAFTSQIADDPARSKTHFAQALALTGRTTERERWMIEARSLFAQGHHDELIRIYDLYLRSYPDDPVVNLNRGLALMRLQRYAEAIAGFEEVLRISPSSAAALINIATCHNATGQDREAVRIYERAFAVEPKWLEVPNLNHEYGFALVVAGEPAQAATLFAKAALNPGTAPNALRSQALLDLYQGKYRDAEAKLRQSQRFAASGTELRRARTQIFLAVVREGQGRRRDQVRELDEAVTTLASTQQPYAFWVFRTAAAYARAGEVDRAARLVPATLPPGDQENRELASEWQRALGEIELARGRHDQALTHLQTADRTHSTPMTLESLAHAYRRGERPEAMAAYETLLKSTDWAGWEAQQRWIEAHVELARLHLTRGDQPKALPLLEEFLQRWRDADADLPIVREAQRLRRRLATGESAARP